MEALRNNKRAVQGSESSGACASGLEASSRGFRWRLDVAISVLLGLVSFLVYNANLRSITAADTYAARYLPFSILRHHSVVLDPIATMVAQGRKLPTASRELTHTAFWIQKGRDDHLVSLYPVVLPVVIAPLYLPVIAYLNSAGWDPLRVDRTARIMEKLCASLLASASVMLLYILLRRRSEPPTAMLLTVVYAFGTTTWVISSQALWPHGLAQLLIVAVLFLITGPCTKLRAATAGFLCALVACNRQPDAILAAGLGLYALWWAGRRAPLFLAAGALPVGLVIAYNLELVGHIAGAYAIAAPRRSAILSGNLDAIDHDPIAGLVGLLFSPTRGLFVFSPFLLFVPLCLPLVLRDRSTRWLTTILGVAVVVQLILYAMIDWRQGISWGPRWQTDVLPILLWMLPPVLSALSVPGRALFILASGIAVAIEAVGAFWYLGVADVAITTAEGPHKMRAAWEIQNAPFIAELKHPRASADLFVELRGSIDVTTVRDLLGAKTGRQVEVDGWALTDGRSPADIAVTVDGRPAAGTSRFFERIDVVRALGEPSPSGWHMTFAADKLAPGEHLVSVLVRAHAGGEPRLLAERRFTLPSEADRELADAARRAAKRLAERQQGPGYWLTAHTDEPRFERPGQEMNTFLNAIIIDIAGPVAQTAGIDGLLGRARGFLTNQIEAGGVVRYHGQPDAPTIGSLGCVITPDADDTALVWRVAPSEQGALLQEALATLGRFRRTDGLYRTWLAPRDRYQCIDAGKDANPADIAIQIHVLMLLAQVDPPAAGALCEALRQRAADDDVWVYYKMAPLLLILRQRDLRKAGCPLPLQPSRLQTTIPGQEIWIEAAELLGRIESVEGRDTAYAEVAALLHKLAANEFSLLAHTPPLLYHNDLNASVRRFYWSEELGYALWLRLYFENERVVKR